MDAQYTSEYRLNNVKFCGVYSLENMYFMYRKYMYVKMYFLFLYIVYLYK